MSKSSGKDTQAALFREAVKDVTPLRVAKRVLPAPRSRSPLPLKRIEDDRQVLADSLSDVGDFELEAGEALAYLRDGLSRQVLRKLRAGHWAIQDQLDLHGLRSDEARGLLVEFLNRALKRSYRCVRVIHGKGMGSVNHEPVLKRKVALWLAQRGEVLAYCQARPAEGGEGAVLLLLKAGTSTRNGGGAGTWERGEDGQER